MLKHHYFDIEKKVGLHCSDVEFIEAAEDYYHSKLTAQYKQLIGERMAEWIKTGLVVRDDEQMNEESRIVAPSTRNMGMKLVMVEAPQRSSK
jgi:hypothetical protein